MFSKCSEMRLGHEQASEAVAFGNAGTVFFYSAPASSAILAAMRATVPILLLAAALGVVGCGLLLDLSDFDDRADGGTVSSGTNTGTDSMSSGSGGSGDCLIPQGACIDDPCVECVPGADADCDGLIDATQDPWPMNPNVRMFSNQPVSSQRWGMTGAVVFEKEGARISSGSRIALLAPCSDVFESSGELTEVAFEWTAASLGGGTVSVFAADTGKQQRVCSLVKEQLELRVCNPLDDCASASDSKLVTLVPGTSFLLQTYATGAKPTHHCRLLEQDGGKVLATASLEVDDLARRLVDPGTISIATLSLQILVKSVRLYQPGPNDSD